MNLQQHLTSIGACSDAIRWAGSRTPQAAWNETDRPDWLIWWRLRVHKTDRAAVLRVIVPLLREHTLPLCRQQDRAVSALDAAEKWAIDPSLKNRLAAAYAAAAADAAYAYAAAAYTAYAAANAAAAYAATKKKAYDKYRRWLITDIEKAIG
jgi:hypothetical protein